MQRRVRGKGLTQSRLLLQQVAQLTLLRCVQWPGQGPCDQLFTPIHSAFLLISRLMQSANMPRKRCNCIVSAE